MAARAFGTAIIDFGIVSIPTCSSAPLLAPMNRVKGDEFAKGQTVLFTDVEVPEAETNNVEFALAAQLGKKVA